MKKTKNANTDTQKRIQRNAERTLRKVETKLQEPGVKKKKDEFLEKYMICETVCKQILIAYKKGTGKEFNPDDIKLHMQEITAAMKYSAYPFSSDTLKAIFGSEKKRNSKSCKKLRNGIVHSMDVNDITEVSERYQELTLAMDTFLHTIHNAPATKKEKSRNTGSGRRGTTRRAA